jgi:hypothetical protein
MVFTRWKWKEQLSFEIDSRWSTSELLEHLHILHLRTSLEMRFRPAQQGLLHHSEGVQHNPGYTPPTRT